MVYIYAIGYFWMWYITTTLIYDTKVWKTVPKESDRIGAAITAGLLWPFVLTYLAVGNIVDDE